MTLVNHPSARPTRPTSCRSKTRINWRKNRGDGRAEESRGTVCNGIKRNSRERMGGRTSRVIVRVNPLGRLRARIERARAFVTHARYGVHTSEPAAARTNRVPSFRPTITAPRISPERGMVNVARWRPTCSGDHVHPAYPQKFAAFCRESPGLPHGNRSFSRESGFYCLNSSYRVLTPPSIFSILSSLIFFLLDLLSKIVGREVVRRCDVIKNGRKKNEDFHKLRVFLLLFETIRLVNLRLNKNEDMLEHKLQMI